MARILVADYGREDLLRLESPLVATLQTWGHEVGEAADDQDVLRQARAGHYQAVILYNTLPEAEKLHTLLQQEAQGMAVLRLDEKVQQMQFTDMVVVAPQYRLGKSRRHFDVNMLKTLLEKAGM